MTQTERTIMNVLSLFDGMSCGQIALDNLGIKVDNYFASEIDKYAIQVAKKNYPNTQHIGDVTNVKAEDLPKIDLLIGGSPCQGFSFAGKQLNFKDERSKLFFEYVRLLKECKPKYFLLENVKMKKEYQEVITDLLGVEPVEINSSLLTAQNRKRIYWTNIQELKQPNDLGIVYQDIVEGTVTDDIVIPKTYTPTLKDDITEPVSKSYRLGGYSKQGQGQRVYSALGKSVCLSALGGGWGAKTGLYWIDGIVRKPTRIELEKLQGVPIGYTESVNYTNAAKMLGNGWTIPVIEHIFSGLKTK